MYKKLPADPNALIFGIISLVIVFLGCCCGPFIVISITLSIVGLILANRSLREYNSSPKQFDLNSKNNVYIAKILNIIALVFSLLFFIVYVIKVAILGSVMSDGIIRNIIDSREKLEQVQDSLKEVKKDTVVEENALYIDTLKVESEKE